MSIVEDSLARPRGFRTERAERPLRNRVVVITGASSGIGRATAEAFARRGAAVVLAARRVDALHQVAAACEALGAQAIAVPADVTNEDEMTALAERAVRVLGRIDIWINNAGVGLFGPFANAPLNAHKRVVETNLFGIMNGAAAVLPHFLRQGRGTMITNISVGGFIPVPFAAAYTASKFALRGFMASLRQELRQTRGIRLCSIFPAVIDTPGFAHGANVSGRKLSPGWPIFPPEKVAEAMVSLALDPRDELSVGWPTSALKAAYAVAPLTTERVAGLIFRRYLRRGEPEERTLGNLFGPVLPGTGRTGGWRNGPSNVPLLVGGALAAGAAVAGWAWFRRGRQPIPDPDFQMAH